MDTDIFEGLKLFSSEEVSYGLLRRLIQDESVGTFVVIMLGEQDYAFIEYAVSQ